MHLGHRRRFVQATIEPLSENYALLIGAITLFTVLATIMPATRKLRWDMGAR